MGIKLPCSAPNCHYETVEAPEFSDALQLLKIHIVLNHTATKKVLAAEETVLSGTSNRTAAGNSEDKTVAHSYMNTSETYFASKPAVGNLDNDSFGHINVENILVSAVSAAELGDGNVNSNLHKKWVQFSHCAFFTHYSNFCIAPRHCLIEGKERQKIAKNNHR